jgi:hemolysin III
MNVFNPPNASSKRMHSSTEELANMISHGFGFLAALIGAPILLLAAYRTGSSSFFVGMIVFVIAILALYLASTLYHAWPETRTKYALRAFDHCAIFFLIAGTYTPFALGPLRGIWGWAILVVVWAGAVLGITVKAIRGTSRHRKLAMSLYLGTGWSALIIIWPAILKLPSAALFLLFAGGVAYTAGVLFFVNKRLRYGHFVWHLFVLAGTSCHFVALFACTRSWPSPQCASATKIVLLSESTATMQRNSIPRS